MGPFGSDESRHIDDFAAKMLHFDDIAAKSGLLDAF